MNSMKKKEEYRDYVFKALLEIKAIETCDAHDDVFFSKVSDSNYVYGAVTNKAKESFGNNIDHALLCQTISDILSEAIINGTCPECDKIKND